MNSPTDKARLSTRDLEWFRIANAGHPYGFYPFKDRFLRRFATLVGYDRQEIEKPCFSCDGTGHHDYQHGLACRRCNGTGIYDHAEHWLERWDLCGRIYHRPIQRHELPEPWYRMKPVEQIEGRIRHAPVSASEAERCFRRLLIRHEPETYYQRVVELWRSGYLHHRARLAWCLIRLRNQLDLFPVKP